MNGGHWPLPYLSRRSAIGLSATDAHGSRPCIHPLQFISRHHRAFFFFAETNKHVFLVEPRDDAFLDFRAAVNAKDHLESDVGLIWLDHGRRPLRTWTFPRSLG